MSKVADDIRGLRNSVVGQFSWDRHVTESKPKKKKVNRFSNWMEEVKEAVDEICGMNIDILDGTNWDSLYNAGSSPDQAAKLALEYAEDDTEDDKDDEDDDLLSVMRDNTLSIKRKRHTEDKHESLRRRGFSLPNRLHKSRNGARNDDNNKTRDHVNENIVEPIAKPSGKDDMFNRVMDMLNNMSDPLDTGPAKQVINEQVIEKVEPKKTFTVASDTEMMMAAQQSISNVVVQEGIDRSNFMNNQALQQRQDEDLLVLATEEVTKETTEEPPEPVVELVSEDVKEPVVIKKKEPNKKKSSKKKEKVK